MTNLNEDAPSVFQKMKAWNDGFDAGYTGEQPKHRYDSVSSTILHDAFMTGYLEGTERRVQKDFQKWEHRQHDYNLRHTLKIDNTTPMQ